MIRILHQAASINCIALSPNGDIVAAAGWDHKVTLWNVSKGERTGVLEGHSKSVNVVSFSGDGKLLATGSNDFSIKLWDVASRELLRTITPDSFDQNADLFKDIRNGKSTGAPAGQPPGLPDVATKSVNSVDFSPDGTKLVSLSFRVNNFDLNGMQFSINLFDVRTGRQLRTLAAFSGGGQVSQFIFNNTDLNALVGTVSFSADGKQVIGRAADYKVEIWDVETGRALHEYTVLLLPDDPAKRLDMLTKMERITWSFNPHLPTFSPDQSKFALVVENNVIIWDVLAGRAVRALGGHVSSIRSIAFDGANKTLAVSSDALPTRLWDLSGTGGARVLDRKAFPYGAFSIAFSPTSDLLATASPGVADTSSSIEIWDVTTTTKRNSFTTDSPGEFSVAFTRDGQYIAVARLQDVVALLDARTGARVREFGDTYPISNLVAVSPNNKVLAHVGWGSSIITNAHVTGTPLEDPRTRHLLESSASSTIRLWDIETGRTIRQISDKGRVFYAMAFAPDGSGLASGGSSGLVSLWNVETGEKLQDFVLGGANISIYSVAFSPDATLIAGGSSEGVVCLWDRVSGKQLQAFRGHTGGVRTVAFSSDGSVLATGGDDGALKIWSVKRKRDTVITLEELATLLPIGQEGWILASADSRFDTEALEQISSFAWVSADEPFRPLAPEIFMRDYYEPRLLPRLLAGEELPKVRPLGDLNRVQPGVEIVGVKRGSQPDLAEVTVGVSPAEGQFQRDGKPVTMKTDVYDLRVFRDGQLVGQEPKLSAEAEGSLKNGVVLTPEELNEWKTARQVKPVTGRVQLDVKRAKLTRTFTMRLPHGQAGKEIEFTAYAFNEDRVKSETAKASYTVPTDAGPVKRRAYVVAMGVNAYENPGWDLRFAASDAETLQKALAKRLPSQYEVVPVTLISDCKIPGCPKDRNREIGKDDAKKASLHAVLELLAGHPLSEELKKSVPPEEAARIRKAEPDDLVVISVSSHGYTSKEGMFYMIPSDSGQTEGHGLTPELRQKWISSDELSAWLREVDAGEIVMVVDTCHSAATVEEPGFKAGPMGSRGLGQLAYDKGMRILTASQANDVALESEKLKQGLLTYALVHDGLEAEQAVTPGSKSEITLEGLLQYGVERVPKLYAEVLTGEVQTFPKASRNVKIDEQFFGGASSLKKPKAFQQPSLFDFKKTNSKIVLQR